MRILQARPEEIQQAKSKLIIDTVNIGNQQIDIERRSDRIEEFISNAYNNSVNLIYIEDEVNVFCFVDYLANKLRHKANLIYCNEAIYLLNGSVIYIATSSTLSTIVEDSVYDNIIVIGYDKDEYVGKYIIN